MTWLADDVAARWEARVRRHRPAADRRRAGAPPGRHGRDRRTRCASGAAGRGRRSRRAARRARGPRPGQRPARADRPARRHGRRAAADRFALAARRGRPRGVVAAGRRTGRAAASEQRRGPAGAAIADALPGEHAEQAGLVDAIDDPGEPERYSEPGYRRIRRLGDELSMLRRRQDQPLPELVADVERTLLLDIEAIRPTRRRRPGPPGRVRRRRRRLRLGQPVRDLAALLDYLRDRRERRGRAEPGEVEVGRGPRPDPHHARRQGPGVADRRRAACGARTCSPGRASRLRGSRRSPSCPPTCAATARTCPASASPAAPTARRSRRRWPSTTRSSSERRLVEERRLCYVALTRSERVLLVSGHWWGETGSRPRAVGVPERDRADVLRDDRASGTVDEWAASRPRTTTNPLVADVARTARWPVDPLARAGAPVLADRAPEAGLPRRCPAGTERRVRRGRRSGRLGGRDVDVLLAERARKRPSGGNGCSLPDQLTVSQLVELAGDPDALAPAAPAAAVPAEPLGPPRHGVPRLAGAAVRRQPAARPGRTARRGRRRRGRRTPTWRRCGRRSWPASGRTRVPHEVEVPFETEVAGVAVRGRMDAVFAEPGRRLDGGGLEDRRGADGERLPALAVQLAAYRLAWAALPDVRCERCARRSTTSGDHTLRPADLLDADGLRALLREHRPGRGDVGVQDLQQPAAEGRGARTRWPGSGATSRRAGPVVAGADEADAVVVELDQRPRVVVAALGHEHGWDGARVISVPHASRALMVDSVTRMPTSSTAETGTTSWGTRARTRSWNQDGFGRGGSAVLGAPAVLVRALQFHVDRPGRPESPRARQRAHTVPSAS